MESPADSLAAAIRLHQLGQLAEAEALYRHVLEQDPKHPGALHLLGVLAHQQGHDDRAAELIALAMELKPNQATHHSNYGVALRGLGRLAEAADALRMALRLWPEYPDAHSNLGLVFQQQGHLALARAPASKRRCDSNPNTSMPCSTWKIARYRAALESTLDVFRGAALTWDRDDIATLGCNPSPTAAWTAASAA